jgi:hypothetical protein
LNTIPIIFFLIVSVLWLVTAVQSAKLFNLFRAKFPSEAQQRVPYAFSRMRHPEKLFFFFRKESMALLQRDAAIWRLRQQLRVLLWVSVLLPVVSFLLILFVAWPDLAR